MVRILYVLQLFSSVLLCTTIDSLGPVHSEVVLINECSPVLIASFSFARFLLK